MLTFSSCHHETGSSQSLKRVLNNGLQMQKNILCKGLTIVSRPNHHQSSAIQCHPTYRPCNFWSSTVFFLLLLIFFFFKDVGSKCSSWRQSTQNPSWYNIINIQRFSHENVPEVKFSLFTAEICSYHKRKSAGKRNSANDGSRPSRMPVPKRTKLGPWNELGLLRRRHFNTIKSPCINIHCQNIFKGACLGYNRATLSA